MAVFLAIGGLLSGLLWSAIFVSNPAGMVQERRVSGGSALIPQAEGAEVDSAALMPQSAPFLASANAAAESIQAVENVDVLYNEGALKDAEPVIKTKTAPSTNNTKETLASGIIYTIATGDTVKSISATFGIPINMIVEFNPSVNFSSLIPGTSIVIPGENDIAG